MEQHQTLKRIEIVLYIKGAASSSRPRSPISFYRTFILIFARFEVESVIYCYFMFVLGLGY